MGHLVINARYATPEDKAHYLRLLAYVRTKRITMAVHQRGEWITLELSDEQGELTELINYLEKEGYDTTAQ